MHGRFAVPIMGAILAASAFAPVAFGVEVPDCPVLGPPEGSYVQCATTPGLMTSTMQVPAGSSGSSSAVGLPQGTWTVRNDLGHAIMGCTFGAVSSCFFGFGFPDHGGPWTSTIELTNGVGAVAIDWNE